MNHTIIPAPFIENSGISINRKSALIRLIATPAKRITVTQLDAFTLEEQVMVYQIALEILASSEYESSWPTVSELAERMRGHMTEKHWALLGHRASAYYKRFEEIGTQGEFFSEAFMGFDHGLQTYKTDKARAKEGGCKVKNWLGRSIDRSLKNFVYDKGVHFRMHTRYYKWRTYFSGGYDSKPEFKKEFEEKNGITTEEAKAKAHARYASIINVTNKSLDGAHSSEGMSEDTPSLSDMISDQEQIDRGAPCIQNALPYTAQNMERRAIIAEFSQYCDPEDYKIWMLVEGECHSQPEVCEMLGKSKADVLNAIRRVTRVRKEYLRKFEAAERKLKIAEYQSAKPMGISSEGCPNPWAMGDLLDYNDEPRKRGRPRKQEGVPLGYPNRALGSLHA